MPLKPTSLPSSAGICPLISWPIMLEQITAEFIGGYETLRDGSQEVEGFLAVAHADSHRTVIAGIPQGGDRGGGSHAIPFIGDFQGYAQVAVDDAFAAHRWS